MEEIRSRLAGGEKFSKIDLKCAYQQMLLDEKAQELCTINTHKDCLDIRGYHSGFRQAQLSGKGLWSKC